MNKAIYFVAAASLALASCSNDETLDTGNQKGISFRTVAGLNSRVAEVTQNNLKGMSVTAFENGADAAYFTDVNYTREGQTNTFVSNPEYNWLRGKTLNFLALATSADTWTAAKAVTFDKATNTYKIVLTDYTPDADISKHQDLMIGTAWGTENNDANGLDLALKHILSQIEVRATNTNAAYVYSIKGVRIVAVKGTGTYTSTSTSTETKPWTPNLTPNWTPKENSKVKYEVVYDDAKEVTAEGMSVMKTEGDNAMLIPQSVTGWSDGTVIGGTANDFDSYTGGTYISLLLNVKSASTGKYIYPAGSTDAAKTYGWAAVSTNNTVWKSGQKYIYTLDLSNGCGSVDPVDPGTGVTPDGTKDPVKGDKIFGDPIKFDVTVSGWADGNSQESFPAPLF